MADAGQYEHIVEQFADRERPAPTGAAKHGSPCFVVSVGVGDDPIARDAQLAEMLGLVRAVGDHPVGHKQLRRAYPDPKTYLGRGAALEVAALARAQGAELLTLDAELSPSQARNLEDVAGLPVCDREAVILNVFLRHARTKRARTQVEIAQLEYLRPRIRGIGLDMDQQAGGLMRARGPGETASELLARQLDGRLVELRKRLTRLERAGATQRKRRDQCARVVLVGYTNAGKTSLMNALTSAGLSAQDLPFETLDTTSRNLSRHGGDVILSDTVGFIRRLPERLLASFESTLAEIHEATLLVIVVDASDPEQDMHITATEAQIARLGAAAIPRYYVFNKLDRATHPPALGRVAGSPSVALSSHDPVAVADLRDALIHAARRKDQHTQLFVPYHATAVLTRAYAECRVLSAQAVERGVVLSIEGEAHVLAQLRTERGESR